VGRPRLAVVLLTAALLAAAAVAGCGNERTAAPRVPAPASPVGKRTVRLPPEGIVFQRPANWTLALGGAPQVAMVGSGRAAVVLWRYPRAEPLPTTSAGLDRARRALLAAATARDRSLRVISSRVVTVGGTRGVEVVAQERLRSRPREVRSTHLYAHGAELVIDAYAPPAEFARVDRTVFRPLLRSLRLAAPGTTPRS
jgi:hypothetical protein